MKIPETPQSIKDLDIMKLLWAYANGNDTWELDGSDIGPRARQATLVLYNNLVQIVEQVFSRILDRATAREMDMFTMHDHTHGLKVAHLMWHIIEPERRKHLTPPEIGLMVAAAHFHDLGMALTNQEREARLDPTSDLWDRLEIQESQKLAIETLRTQSADPNVSESARTLARHRLEQAEEALLSQDTRDRHAMRERYEEVLALLKDFHKKDGVRIPDVMACLTFDNDQFVDKVVEICLAHRGDPVAMVESDEMNPERPRFPHDYPIGCCTADLHLVAAALRLADTLDFDRERTPQVLFHYLLPGTLSYDNRSVLEWNKHLAISNWHIDADAIVFRGRCNSHVIHHTIVQFCLVIEEEIKSVRSTFGALQEHNDWPLILPPSVKADIHEEGYHYIPYRFELDDERVYSLLMGGALYDHPLVAVRELIQNAVDACKLRDALTQLREPVSVMSTDRIFVRYEEPTDQFTPPKLSVTDTGTGMDAWLLERYFLKVGRSYYYSSDFLQTRLDLRKKNLDFAPISEFGIGFLSCFLLSDRVTVETALWEPIRGDIRKRTLQIDGPTRLIRLEEKRNEGINRFKGTRVTLHLKRDALAEDESKTPQWTQIANYVSSICQDLPYELDLEHVDADGIKTKLCIAPHPLRVDLPDDLEPLALRIPVDDDASGLEGEVTFINTYLMRTKEEEQSKEISVDTVAADEWNLPILRHLRINPYAILLRGGFVVDDVAGLPHGYFGSAYRARLRLKWQSQKNRRFLTPNLARNSMTNPSLVRTHVMRLWLTYIIDHVDKLPRGYFYGARLFPIEGNEFLWLEKYDALSLYRMVEYLWYFWLHRMGVAQDRIEQWENSDGEPLPVGSFDEREARWVFLNLLMPHVTTLQLRPHGKFGINPPQLGWQERLAKCHDFISSPVNWGPFAEYAENIADLVMYKYPNVEKFNLAFQDRLSSFSSNELQELHEVFEELIRSKEDRQVAKLSETQVKLLHLAQETIGDLKIGTINGQEWKIGSFTVRSA
jgi:hypothetical protein